MGQPVAAIGSPFGEEQSLSVGVISATDRSIQSLTDFTIDGAIQTDASINPGNSGGPLLDAEGRLIGLNTPSLVPGGTTLPVATVAAAVTHIEAHGSVQPGLLGVNLPPRNNHQSQRVGISGPL